MSCYLSSHFEKACVKSFELSLNIKLKVAVRLYRISKRSFNGGIQEYDFGRSSGFHSHDYKEN